MSGGNDVDLLVRGVWETLAMTLYSPGFFGFVIGLPVGVLLYVTRPGRDYGGTPDWRNPLHAVVNIFRSIRVSCWWMIPLPDNCPGTPV